MNAFQTRIIGAGILFFLIFIFGYWLNRTGKPLPVALLTLHKLASLGAIAYLAWTISLVHRVSPLGTVQIIAIGVAGLCFLLTIATGGLLSLEKEMPEFVHRLHQFTPYLTLLATAAALYLMPVIRAGLAKG